MGIGATLATDVSALDHALLKAVKEVCGDGKGHKRGVVLGAVEVKIALWQHNRHSTGRGRLFGPLDAAAVCCAVAALHTGCSLESDQLTAECITSSIHQSIAR